MKFETIFIGLEVEMPGCGGGMSVFIQSYFMRRKSNLERFQEADERYQAPFG